MTKQADRSVFVIVPAVPVAQPRAKATTIGGHARMYEADKTHAIHAFKASVRLAWAEATDDPPHDGPVGMSAIFVMPRPKAKRWKTKPMPRYRHVIKPDLDNLVKAVKDALTGLAWVDDSLVCELAATKHVASGGEAPHVDLCITFDDVDE